MKHNFKLIGIAIFSVLVLSGCTTLRSWYNSGLVKIGIGQRLPKIDMILETDNEKIELKVEVADEPKEREIGLIHRNNLKENRGMWFEFDAEGERRFWMKNMKMPLDILYFNKDKEIRSILEDVPPCEENPCPTHKSSEPAQYVLELPSGFVEEHGVEVGDTVYEVK